MPYIHQAFFAKTYNSAVQLANEVIIYTLLCVKHHQPRRFLHTVYRSNTHRENTG